MKRFTAVALVITGLAIPSCAQRMASRSGFSGHSSQVVHGGFAPTSRYGFPAAPTFNGSRPPSLAPRILRTSPTYYNRRTVNPIVRYRRPYTSFYGVAIPYGYPGWIGPDYLAYPNPTAYDDSVAPPNYGAAPDYDEQPAEETQATARISERSSPATAMLESEDAVTLIFKDGRPPEQIHNYILTRTTLSVWDHRHRDIPVDQLDLTATEKVNHDAGVDFQLPTSSK